MLNNLTRERLKKERTKDPYDKKEMSCMNSNEHQEYDIEAYFLILLWMNFKNVHLNLLNKWNLICKWYSYCAFMCESLNHY